MDSRKLPVQLNRYAVRSKEVKALALAPVLAYLAKASPSSHSNILCSKKWAMPGGTSTKSSSRWVLKVVSMLPTLAENMA